MSRKDLDLHIAAMICDALEKVNTGKREVEELDRQVKAAQAEVSNATEANKAEKQRQLKNLEERHTSAKKILDFDEKQLAKLFEQTGERGKASKSPAVVLQYIIFSVLALIVIGFLMYGIANNKLLTTISGIASARGLITFLIAVVTVTIAITLALATVVSDSPDRSERFLQGKEVLTALIGVLGTIVGFYFGHSLDETEKNLEIAPIYVSNESPRTGEKVSLVTFISAGKSPYSYDITFEKNTIREIKGQTSDGLVRVEFEAPAVENDSEVDFMIMVTDSSGKSGQYNSRDHGKSLHLKPMREDTSKGKK